MTLHQLRYFLFLAETEHYGITAKTFFISQPALSKSISQLEEELGVRLFQKAGRNVKLTPEGQIFRSYVQDSLKSLDLGISQLMHFTGKTSQISIGSVSQAVTPYVSVMLADYKKEISPETRFNITLGQTEFLLDQIKKGKLSVAFGSYYPTPGIEFIPVAKLPFVVAIQKDDALAQGDKITPDQLKESGRPMLFTNAPAYNDLLWKILKHYDIHPIINGYASEETALTAMVEAGHGVILTCDYPMMHSPGVKLIPFDQPDFCRVIYMAYSTEHSYPNVVQQFINYNKERGIR